jgi:D-sedoheptulose 7-phosphate isomerase
VNRIEQALQDSIELKQRILQSSEWLEKIEQATYLIYEALKTGHKILFCGNGGSAADAQHLAAEFSGRFYFDREPLPSEALHCNTSYLTAVGNDYGYEQVYARMIRAVGNRGDVLAGLSTSGNSENIILAFETAKKKEMLTIGFTGEGGGRMKEYSDLLLPVPSKDTPRIQEVHITIGHILCELVEQRIFGRQQ